jgi:cell wall-associated NlpC family hydrolase
MSQQEERERVLHIAESFIGTPHHHGARVKGAGIDCAQFIAATFEESGLEAPIIFERYMPDWYMHRSDELLLDKVLERCVQIDLLNVQPADIVIYKFGRCFAHGGIIVKWPQIIHAFIQARRVTLDMADQGIFAGRERRFFTRKDWA